MSLIGIQLIEWRLAASSILLHTFLSSIEQLLVTEVFQLDDVEKLKSFDVCGFVVVSYDWSQSECRLG